MYFASKTIKSTFTFIWDKLHLSGKNHDLVTELSRPVIFNLLSATYKSNLASNFRYKSVIWYFTVFIWVFFCFVYCQLLITSASHFVYCWNNIGHHYSLSIKSSIIKAGQQQQRSTSVLECIRLSLKVPIKTCAHQESRYIMGRPLNKLCGGR